MNCKHCGHALSSENVTSCPICGEPTLEPYVVTSEQMSYTQQASYTPAKSENIITGTVGALIGAAIGALVIVLLGRVGVVASISGFVLAVCTLKGYVLLGHNMSMKGFVVCLILIIITPYFADRLDLAFVIKEASADVDLSLGESYSLVPELLKLGIIDKFSYIRGLVFVYVFAALGAFNTIRDLFK